MVGDKWTALEKSKNLDRKSTLKQTVRRITYCRRKTEGKKMSRVRFVRLNRKVKSKVMPSNQTSKESVHELTLKNSFSREEISNRNARMKSHEVIRIILNKTVVPSPAGSHTYPR